MNETTLRDLWVRIEANLPWLGGVLLALLLGLMVGMVGARLTRRWVERASAPLGAGRASLLGRLSATAFFVMVVLGTLNAVGLPFTGVLGVFAGAAGIAGVAIGFASQTSASNIISGLFLLGERPFEEGDAVRIGEVTGMVLSVELLSVKLRTFDNLFVRVPNETAMRSTITNLSRFGIRRIDLPLRFAADASLDTVKTVFEQCADEQPYILTHPPPTLLFNGLVDGAIELQLSAWASSAGFAETRARWSLTLIAALRAHGLRIEGATRTVRVVNDPPPLDGAGPPEPIKN